MQIIERFATLCPCWIANVQRADARYRKFQDNGPQGLMLHSVGCAQPSAEVFAQNWNKATNDRAIVHAVIDANDGNPRQLLKWNYRGWHAGGAANNTHIGVEMCESSYIKYHTDKPWLFDITNKAKAQEHCKTAYEGAVELFAYLCKTYHLDPLTKIISHKEGNALGIASAHGDPEHYWKGLGMSYTMDGFRRDVKAKMQSNAAPETSTGGYLGFPDVDEDDWYANALQWAVEHNVVAAAGKPFYPDLPLTKSTGIVLMRRMYNALLKELKGGG